MKRQWYQAVKNQIVQRCARSRAGMILEDINVYYKRDVANADREPAAHLDKLVVRAVNLEGQDE